MQSGEQDSRAENVPANVLLVLTPEEHLQERIDADGFVEFVQSALGIMADQAAERGETLSELQIACALLPDHRLIVEVQATPPEERALHASRLTSRLRQLAVPAVQNGPVVFAQRRRFVEDAGGTTFPFASYVTRSGPVPLDDVLLEAGGLRIAPVSMWARIRRFLGGPVKVGPSKSGSSRVLEAVTDRVGSPVANFSQQLVFTGTISRPSIEGTRSAAGFATVRYPGGGGGLVDSVTVQYLESETPQPTQVTLEALLASVGRVRVLDGGVAGAVPSSNTVLLDVTDEPDLAELRRGLEILDGPAGHCMCIGHPSLELLSKQDERLAVFGLHHGRAIRWAAWRDDAELLDGRRVLDWMAARGARGPLDRYMEDRLREEEARAAWQRWITMMPECLRRLPDEIWVRQAETGDFSPALDALEAAYADAPARTLLLLRWLGSGTGPWNGFPTYEQIPEQLLLCVPIEQVIAAVETEELTDDQLEGAARFFGGYAFANRAQAERGSGPRSPAYSSEVVFFPSLPRDQAPIPAWLRRRLLDHCLRSHDEDKIRRAEAAFAA